MFILPNNPIFMKNFINYLIIITLLLSCKKKESEQPKTDPNIGKYEGVFNRCENGVCKLDTFKTIIEITNKEQLIVNDMYFMMLNYKSNTFQTGLAKDKLYQKWDKGFHTITNETLSVDFEIDSKIFVAGKFNKIR